MRVERAQGGQEGLALSPKCVEMDVVRSFDVGQGDGQQRAARLGEAHLPSAAVGAIDVALE